MNTPEKNDALYGGRQIAATFLPASLGDPATTATIFVRQVQVAHYPAGFKTADDEIALVGFLCGQGRPWAVTLTPESYEEILKVGEEVNRRGFFAYCDRQKAAAQKRERQMLALMADLPPDVVKLAMETGLRARST